MDKTSSALPSQAQVVIIGGGIIGCSLAYHLTKIGYKDVIILERGHLTCGTSWHAAGLIVQLRSNYTQTVLSQYTADLYGDLERETGLATGFQRNGSMPVARTTDRLIEIRRMAALGKCFGVDVHEVSPSEAKQIWPMLDSSKIKGAVYIPTDGQTNPVDTTMALAKGARTGGALIYENTEVTKILKNNSYVSGVETIRGNIACEIIVNCAGIWAAEIGKMADVRVPIYAAEHMYVVTEAISNLKENLPIIRDTDGYIYIKEDAGRLLVGSFEPVAKPLPLNRLPADTEFIELQEDWDHFELPLTKAIELLPSIEHAPIRKFLNGPESFTPDNKFVMGEAPELNNFFVVAGFNSSGILSAAGAGKVMAEWIVEGQPTVDLAELDIARFNSFQSNSRYLFDRTSESLGLLYKMHWPYRQVESARPARLSPLHQRLVDSNACFGEVSGWERANWFAPKGVDPIYEHNYSKQNWFEYVREEHHAVRNTLGIIDMSSFAKFLVQGQDAEIELQRIAANNVSVLPGKIVYTQFLNSRGGIEADLTITRLSNTEYFVVTSAASQTRVLTWMKRQVSKNSSLTITDITSGYGVIALMGPKAREVMSSVSDTDFSNNAFPFGTYQEIDIGYAIAKALRITYVGELGWELYIPTEFMIPVFDLIKENSMNVGSRLCGLHAVDSLRMEKGYRHWGHDITQAETPIEAGLHSSISFKKGGDFIGRKVLEKQKSDGFKKRLVHIMLEKPEPLIFHDETIYLDNRIVGRVSSGAYSYYYEKPMGMGYIEIDKPSSWEDVPKGNYEVDFAGQRVPIRISLLPFFDPKGERIYA